MMTDTLQLAKALISIESVTPNDNGCLELIAQRLQPLGFTTERIDSGAVSNLWATLGDEGPLLVFAGHTDVVPPGSLNEWRYPPFQPTEDGEFLYGRGSADMKSSLAAMVTACERFIANRLPAARLAFLITSDEEGQAVEGTRYVIERLTERGEKINYCVVGEPSSSERLGDTIRVGRRGSLSCKLRVNGIKGHVAYPHLARNPIHEALPVLLRLSETHWDDGNESFQPTSFQISNIHGGVGANNVIPDRVEIDFNLRFSTEHTSSALISHIEQELSSAGVDYQCEWHVSGEPFLTVEPELITVVQDCVKQVTGILPEASTGGGTSDGRFIAPTGAQVVEIGPCNATIHKLNERMRITDIEKLSAIYELILQRLL